MYTRYETHMISSSFVWWMIAPVSIVTLTTAPEVARMAQEAPRPTDLAVILWTMGPGLLAGLSLQLVGEESRPRRLAGELIASAVAGLLAGAYLMAPYEAHPTVWTLAGWAIAAGALGSGALRAAGEGLKRFIGSRRGGES